MNILFIQPSNAIGGAELSLLDIIEGFTNKYSINCYVALLPSEKKDYEDLLRLYAKDLFFTKLFTWNLNSKKLFSKLIHILYKFYKQKPLITIFRLLKFIKEKKIDIIYSNSGLCPIGGFCSRLLNIPHIWHVRERIGKGTEFPIFLDDKLSRYIFNKFSDVIICNSNYTASFFDQKSKNLHVVRNGIKIKSFFDDDILKRSEKLRNDLNISDDAYLIGMVGNIKSHVKEHDVFLKFVKILKLKQIKAKFIIFGGSSNANGSKYALKIFRLVKELDIESDLIFADIQNDIPAMMKSLNLLVHPSSTEGSGRVIMEAMAAGTPVLGINEGGVSELIINGVNGIKVPSKRYDLLAEETVNIIKNDLLRQDLIRNALEFSYLNFNVERTVSEIFQILSKNYITGKL